jgi:hypothetical protein
MRALLVPILVALVAGAVGAMIVLWTRGRFSPVGGVAAVERVLAANGAGRCVEATRLLRELGARGDSAGIARDFNAIEMALLQAIPDCPPDYKVELIAALDACARACRVVEVTKRIMTMRNSMLA